MKVIYIVGYGRSGSTIMDIALGQHPDVFAAGEMSAISRHVWTNNEYCACGQTARACSFWGPVVNEWIDQGVNMANFAKSQSRFERGLSLGRLKGGYHYEMFVDHSVDLIERVAHRSGGLTVLDSSKLPGRGFVLAGIKNLDLRVIHLVRDARAVAHSLTKAMEVDPSKGLQKRLRRRFPLRTALRWNFVNWRAEQLSRLLGPEKFVRIKYEALVEKPRETLAKVGSVVGMDFTDLAEKIDSGQAILPGHQIAGSRIRMSKTLKLEADMNWIEQMPAGEQKLVQAAASSRLRKYGYID